MPIAPKSLASIAESSGFSMSDVAFLARLDESTVCRLWDDPDWLDRVKGRSLQAIVSVLPGVGEYILGYSLADRRTRLAESLSKNDVQVNQRAFRHLVVERRVPEQYLSNALDTAAYVLDGNTQKAAAHLARFWGRDQDFALGLLFGNYNDDGLLLDTKPLVAASIDMIDSLNTRSNSFHAIVAQANLMHHVSRATNETLSDADTSGISRHTALAFRSSVIGKIMASNDLDVSQRYCAAVDSSPLLSIVEGWAFPTYTHDAKPTPDFSLPRSLLLRQTAEEVMREVREYNDAYLFYLADTSIPTIIKRDPTFGLQLDQLVSHLRARLDQCTEHMSRTACIALIDSLEHQAPSERGDSFGRAW